MSRTNKTNLAKNPATKFLEWKAKQKSWSYWDKEAEKEVLVSHDQMAFIVLDQLSTVKGFDRRTKQGFWSNEVRDIKKDILTVRSSQGVAAEGVYDKVKADSRFKYVKSIYVMAKIGGEYQLANLQLKGSAMGSWIDFSNTIDVETDVAIGVTDLTEDETESGKFWIPTFGVITNSLSPEASKQADEMDKKLQAYLKEYFSNGLEVVGAATNRDSDLDENGVDVGGGIELDEDEHNAPKYQEPEF